MKIKMFIVVAFLAICMIPASSFAVGVGDKAPSFKVNLIDGTEFSSDDVIGKEPLAIVFWATWCPGCKRELPDLAKMYKTFSPMGLRMISINGGVNDSLEKTKKFVNKYDMPYPVAFDDGSKVVKDYEIRGVPSIIIVDRQGIVQYAAYGAPTESYLRDNLATLKR